MKDRIIYIIFMILIMVYLYFAYLIYHIKMVDEILLMAIRTNQEMSMENYRMIHNRILED